MKKSLKTVLIISLVLVAVGTACCVTALANVDFKFRNLSPERHTEKHSQEMTIDNIENINISTLYSDIKIYPSRDEKLHLSYYTSDEFDFSIKSTDSTITIAERRIDRAWYEYLEVSFGSDDVKLVAEIPEGFKGSIDISGDSADASVSSLIIDGALNVSADDINVTSLSTSDANISSDNGEITCSDITAVSSVNISTATGDISLGNITCAGAVNCSTDSSEIRQTGTIKAESVNVSSDYGSVLLDKIDAAKTDVKTESASISGISVGRETDYTIFAKADEFKKELNTGTVNGDRVLRLESEYGTINWSFTE